jgi:hypothetical protein
VTIADVTFAPSEGTPGTWKKSPFAGEKALDSPGISAIVGPDHDPKESGMTPTVDPEPAVHLADPGHTKAVLLRFPSAAELDAVVDQPLCLAHVAIESIVFRLKRVIGLTARPMPGRLEEPPSFADLGVLWNFIADTDVDIAALAGALDELRELMPYLAEMRREKQITCGESVAAA